MSYCDLEHFTEHITNSLSLHIDVFYEYKWNDVVC